MPFPRLLLLSTLLTTTVIYAQDPPKQLLDSATFHKVINRQFTSLITGQLKNTLGNFAAVDVKDAKLTLNGSHIFSNGNVLSFNAAGAVTDGVFAIFNNSTFNSDIAVGAQFHIINPYTRRVVNFDLEDYEKIQVDAQRKKALLLIRKQSAELNLDTLSWRAQIRKLEKEINELPKPGNPQETNDNLAETIIRHAAIDSMNVLIKHYNSEKAIEAINDEIIAASTLKTDAITVLGFKLGWWTIGYTATNATFKTVEPGMAFASQVVDRSYTGHDIKLQFNLYNYNRHRFESYYWLAGVSLGIGTNQSDLKKREIRDTRTYQSNDTVRTINDVYNAYEGIYQKDVKKFRLYTDYYRFLFSKNVAALHVYPDVLVQTGKKPKYNCGVGLLYSFKDSKDDIGKSMVNIELYYQFVDLTNSRDEDEDFFERNSIGLRVAFPFKFLN